MAKKCMIEKEGKRKRMATKDAKRRAALATIGTLGPMLGLVGTVWGMIQSFMVLARPGAEVRIEDLTKGISHALVITLLGIALSVPAIFFHAFFKLFLFPRWGDPPPSRRGHRKKKQRVVVVRGR